MISNHLCADLDDGVALASVLPALMALSRLDCGGSYAYHALEVERKIIDAAERVFGSVAAARASSTSMRPQATVDDSSGPHAGDAAASSVYDFSPSPGCCGLPGWIYRSDESRVREGHEGLSAAAKVVYAAAAGASDLHVHFWWSH